MEIRNTLEIYPDEYVGPIPELHRMYELMNEESRWYEVQYFASFADLEPDPSDSVWMVPGSYVEDL